MNKKAIVDGALVYVSASQLATFQSCRRRWYLEKVEGVREEQTDAQSLGENVHKQIETYFLDPKHPAPENVAAARLVMHPLVPKPDPENVLLEYPEDYDLHLTAAGIPVYGRIDLLNLTPGLDYSAPRIIDWKTTKNIRKYAKTSDDLARNTQLLIYAKAVMLQHPWSDITVAHGYVQSDGGDQALVKSDPLAREFVDDLYSSDVVKTVESMKLTAGLSSYKVVAPTFSRNTCRAYNKLCPAAGHCGEEAYRAAGIDPPEPDTSVAQVDLSAMMQARRRDMNTDTTDDSFTIQPSTKASLDPAIEMNSGTGLLLLIDCLPKKGLEGATVTRLEDEIQARTPEALLAAAKMERNAVPSGAVDVREVKFGHGRAALLRSFKNNPPTGLVLASNSGLSADVLEVLIPLATYVLKGT